MASVCIASVKAMFVKVVRVLIAKRPLGFKIRRRHPIRKILRYRIPHTARRRLCILV